MFGFITRLFGSDTPAPATPPRRSSLGLESLEVRETPSAISAALKQISHTIQQEEKAAAAYYASHPQHSIGHPSTFHPGTGQVIHLSPNDPFFRL